MLTNRIHLSKGFPEPEFPYLENEENNPPSISNNPEATQQKCFENHNATHINVNHQMPPPVLSSRIGPQPVLGEGLSLACYHPSYTTKSR